MFMRVNITACKPNKRSIAMKGILTAVLLVALVFGVGCKGTEEPVNVPENTNEGSPSISPDSGAINDTLEEHPDLGEDLTTKYFEPYAGPSGGEGVEIPEGETAGRPYLMATFDENGNLLSESFYGESGEKCFGPNEWNSMIHSYEYTYDANSNKTSVTTLGIDGEYVASCLPPGVYRWEWEYDGKGNSISERMLYLDGKVREFTPDGEGGVTERWYRADE
jgi:hypothetical protein